MRILVDHSVLADIRLETLQAVEDAFERLYAQVGDPGLDGEPRPRVIRLDPAAAALWADWYGQHVASTATDDFPERLRGPWAKMPTHLARLTLILQTVQEPDAAEVSVDTLGAAADMLDYFMSHARRAYQQLGRQRKGRALKVLSELKQRGPTAQHILLREVFQRNMSAADLRSALGELEEAGLATQSRDDDTGGRPAVIWAAT